jgi:hypothetical protein
MFSSIDLEEGLVGVREGEGRVALGEERWDMWVVVVVVVTRERERETGRPSQQFWAMRLGN